MNNTTMMLGGIFIINLMIYVNVTYKSPAHPVLNKILTIIGAAIFLLGAVQ